MNDYAQPEVLVSTSWVNDHRGDASVHVVEVDVTAASYYEGHIPGALGWDWSKQLCDTLLRDILSKEAFEELMSSSGISPDSTVVLYGDNNNWFAAWALWQMKIYGHRDVRLMNGGRVKWVAEGRDLTLDIPKPARTQYRVTSSDMSLRSLLPEVQTASAGRATNLVDVRSPAEFSGELLAPPGLPETCQRGGHIPGARSIPWGEACNSDGTFKSVAELKQLYEGRGVTSDRPTIAYCRIGERSSHSWFVLKYLLGYPNVTNYDGSWTEWGNLVLAPIERDFPDCERHEVADMSTFRPEGFQKRRMTIEGFEVGITTYKLVDRYLTKVDNVSPGAIVARGEGSTPEEAEKNAIALASDLLRTTRARRDDRERLLRRAEERLASARAILKGDKPDS